MNEDFNLELDLNIIKELSEKNDDENWGFHSFLKGYSKDLNPIILKLYDLVSSKIDCKTCANCCKEIEPTLDEDDIKRLSSCLRISVTSFKERYVSKYTEGFFNKIPCPFLKDNECSCYDYRPKDCVSYPNIHEKGYIQRKFGLMDNISICPIIFNVYELLKKKIRS